MKYFVMFLTLIGIAGTAFAFEHAEETQLHLFDYLKDKPIAYIIDYDIDGYLKNAVVDFHSNTIIFEIKDSGVLTVEIPKTHFLPTDYFPTLLINKVDEDPRNFLTKDEECFKEYRFSVDQSTMIELIMERSFDATSVINENILANCQNKIDDEITNTFDFNTILENGREYTIIDGKQYLSKTIKSSLAHLTDDKTIFELSEIKFHFYDEREDKTVFPGMGIMGLRTPVLFEFPDGVTEEISIKTIPTPQDVMDKQYTTMETISRSNWPEIGVIAGLIPSNQITKLLVFEKNISPYTQLQYGIEPKKISCKEEFILIQKYDGSPACVSLETKQKLIERGWAKNKTTKAQFHDTEYSINEQGKIDLSKIDLPKTDKGRIDYTRLGYLVSETQFKKMLAESEIEYEPDNFTLITGTQLDSGPPYTGYCGYVEANDMEDYWFSGGYHNDTLTSYGLYPDNPNPCKPNTASCQCSLQTQLAEKTLSRLSYFNDTQESDIAEIVYDYITTGNKNITPKFKLGKYNLDYEGGAVAFCGEFWGYGTFDYFMGWIQNGSVVGFGIKKEQPKLCAISDNTQYFGKVLGEE